MNIKKQVIGFTGVILAVSNLVWANLPYVPVQFPRDEAAHDKNVPYDYNRMTEWWYFNGKITTAEGRHFGYYISHIYMKLTISGTSIKIPLYTLQITDIDNQKVYGHTQLIPDNQCFFSDTRLDVSMGKEITLQKSTDGAYQLKGTVTSRQGPKLTYALQLTPTRDVLFINKTGLADMWDNTNSYYYSYTHINTTGFIQIANEKHIVDAKNSLSWMDHQWGDFLISPLNKWIWEGIQLDNGIDINLAVIMDHNMQPQSRLANIIMPDGSRVYTHNIQVKPHVNQGEGYPQVIEISIPEINLHVMLTSEVRNQDMGGLFEGIGHAEAMYQGKPVQGFAYMETTIRY
jgi:predicted secreted hydrolase